MGGMPLRGRVAAFLVVAAGALALVLTAVPAPAAAAGTTLTVIRGAVTVTRSGTAMAGSSGDVVRPGETVTTGSEADAVLTFVDGSTTSLSPRTSVVVEDSTIRSGAVSIQVFQTIGLTWSSVARLLAPGSRFEVRTRAATASVRGTAFEVEVSPAGATRVRTAQGSVAVSNDRGSVIVGEGSETTAEPGGAPASPAPAPPATRRTIEIGSRSVIVIDRAGRGCGVHEGRAVQQIPGCVVRDGAIELQDVERVGEYRLAVTDDVAGGPVRERTVSADAGSIEREVTLPGPEGITPIQVAETARPLQVTLPGIGTIPVQVDLASAAPAPTTTAGTEGQRLTLPPLPFPPPSPTLTPAPATPLPTPTLEIQTPAPIPTLATPSPTMPLTPPAVEISSTPSPTPTPTPSPSPSPTPSPSPSPSASATPAGCVTLLGVRVCPP